MADLIGSIHTRSGRGGSRHREVRARRPMVRLDSVALACSVGVSSALSFAVHAVSSRSMTVADYGGLAAVLALMTVAAVPVGAMQTALTRSASQILAGGRRPSGWVLLSQILPISVLLAGVVAMGSPGIAAFLNLATSAPIALGGLWTAVVLIGAAGKALLVATEEHRSVAHALVHGAVVRLVAVALLTPSMGISGGIVAAIIGDLVSTLIYLGTAWRRDLLDPSGEAARVALPDAGRALSAQLSLWLLASVAVIVGRRTLSGADSGAFAAMATVAASCVFLPQAVATIVFPRFVADGSSRLLVRATLLAALVGAACAAALTVRPDIVFVVFFGPSYSAARGVLLILCLHFVSLGCLTVLSQYLVARRHAGVVSIWLALAVAFGSAQVAGQTPLALAIALAVPTALATVFLGVRALTAREPAATVSLEAAAANGDRHILYQPATLDVSVVIPSYNGGAQLRPCVLGVMAALDSTSWSYEVIVSIDGSTDGSEGTITDLGPRVLIDSDPLNRGKGAALRRGFLRARGAAVGFIDGDGDIAPTVVVDLVHRLQAAGSWAAIATKNHPGAAVSASAARRIMSAAYRLIVHWMFDLQVTDTQCGCKVFRREFLAATIGQAREDGFALDLELLTIGSRLGMRNTVEVPVVLARVHHSTISRRAALHTLTDTIRIRRRLPQAAWGPLDMVASSPVGAEFSSPLLP